jgi:hypothetical protein
MHMVAKNDSKNLAFENKLEFAQAMDETDPLRDFAQDFYFPNFDGRKVVYLTESRGIFMHVCHGSSTRIF